MDKGAYIYYNSIYNCNSLFLYIKLTKEELKNALPISYKEDSNNEYLGVIFINGRDYLGQNNYENISQFIENNKMIDIFSTCYTDCSYILKNLTEEEYNDFLNFSKNQLYFFSINHP